MANKKNAAKAAQSENEQTAQVENPAVETQETDIATEIKNNNKMSDNILKEAEDRIKKEQDEKKIYELKNCICEADYINKRELLELRKRRAEAKATKEALTATKVALDDLKSGKTTPKEYEKAIAAAKKVRNEAFETARKERDELVEELRNNYSGYYSYEWEYERWTDSRASRFNW